MVKISDIAEKADVSITTVSLALNNKPGVGEETKNKILKIAEELNYIKTVKTTRNGSIRLMRIVKHGHTINRDHDIFLSHYIDSITDACQQYSCDLQVVSCRLDETEQKLKSFSSEGVIGIIVIGTELSQSDIQSFERYQSQFPTVFIDTYFPSCNFDFVDMDNVSAVNDILDYLTRNNHGDIGMVSSPVDSENFRQREKAFKSITSEMGNIQTQDFEVDSTYEGAYHDFKKIIQSRKHLPSALFCVNDIVALGCMRALLDQGLRIPEDVSLIGFDNLPQSRMASTPLTTVEVNHSMISEYAVRLLFNKIESTSQESRVKVSIGTTLITRDSVLKLD